MTQTDRLLAALTRAGARGVTAVDFAAPTTCDGGPPIMRVAARVKELRDAGFRIETDGERDSCAVYRLVAQTASGVPVPGGTPGRGNPVSSAEPASLFDTPATHDSSHWKAA